MANVFQTVVDRFKGFGELAGALGESARAKKQAEEVGRKLEERQKAPAPTLSGNVFKDIAQNLNPAIPSDTQIFKPESQAGKAIESAKVTGTQLREEVVKPKVDVVTKKIPETTFNVFANISKLGGAVASRYGAFATPEDKARPFKPAEGAKTVTEALRDEPFFGEVVKRGAEKTPLGAIPGVAAVVGFLSEGLLPPYGAGAVGKTKFLRSLAKEGTESGVKDILKSGIKDLAENEADDLARKIAPLTSEAEITKILEQPKPGVIPRELEPLAAEARKYKSAEEFGKALAKVEDATGENTLFGGRFQYHLTDEGSIKLGISPEKPLRVSGRPFFGNTQSGNLFAIDTTKLPEGTLIEGPMANRIQVDVPKDAIIPLGKVTPREPLDLTKRFYDFYNKAVGGVEPPKPPVKPPIEPTGVVPPEEPQNAIQKLIKAVDEAVPLRGEQKKLYQQELAKRTARVAAAGERVAGEAGFFAQLGQLKGALPKKQFEAIRKQFTQKEADLLFDTIEQTKTLLPLEKVATKGGLTKLFEGVVPTKSEIELLRQVFPRELIDSVLARRPIFEKAKELIGEILNIPRTLMATLDLSAPFRQGIFMIGRPMRFAQAFKDMFKFAVSEKAYQGLMEGITARPTYLKMRQARLALTEIGGPITKREERFMGALAEKIPGYGALVRGSNRAYTGFLNKLRADIFDDILAKAKLLGREVDEPLLGSIADFVNAGTGRGKFGLAETGVIPKSMEKAAVILNGVFFSPRLMASRLNLLNPYFYVQLDPLVRKEAIKTLFATTGILGSIYGVWKLNGGNVGLDPRNADFGKVKMGNTRFDLLGGFQQYIRLAAQLITGEIISSTTGRTITLGEGYKPLTRKDIILRFFENKTSPIASFIIGLLTSTTATGEDVDIPTEVINRFIPMVVQDLYDLSQEQGAEGILYGLPAIFGVGVQTYGKQELAFGESKLGEPTTQIRPVPELADKIRELVIGQLPLGVSKGFSVEAYFDQLSNLPREEASEIFNKIAKTNPELAKKLSDVVKERERGITVKDKDLKAKGVASGDRALAVKKELDKLKTREEKSALWGEYVRKGIITKDVSEQLLKLLNQ